MSTVKLADVGEARLFDAQDFPSPEADLLVFEENRDLPFTVRRAFFIHAREPMSRGRHAHRQCKQLMICVAGACEVTVDGGGERRAFSLDRPDQALYVPPSLWAEQDYLAPGTILTVLCDRVFEEADYIRDYASFLSYRSGAAD